MMLYLCQNDPIVIEWVLNFMLETNVSERELKYDRIWTLDWNLATIDRGLTVAEVKLTVVKAIFFSWLVRRFNLLAL